MCSAGKRKQAGARVAVQQARGAEREAVAKAGARAVPGRNIPPGCAVPHASASSFCSETRFSPKVKERDRELMSERVTCGKNLETNDLNTH